jgi:hypothetical protein
VRFQANIECVERHGTPLTHPQAAGGCEARERGRVGSTKVVMGQVLGGGGEMGDELRKVEKCFCFRLPLCVWAFGGRYRLV